VTLTCMQSGFTLSRRDVVDASGHKHGADGKFGSGGSAKAGKKKDRAKAHQDLEKLVGVQKAQKVQAELSDILGKDHELHSLLEGFGSDDAKAKLTGIRTFFDPKIKHNPGLIRVEMDLLDKAGKKIGHSVRQIRKTKEGLVADQEELFLNHGKDSTNAGLGSKIISNNFALYEKLGVKTAFVHAEHVGSYVWAKMGYSADPEDLDRINTEFSKYTKLPKRNYSLSDIADYNANGKTGKSFLLKFGETSIDGKEGWSGRISVDRADPGYQRMLKYLARGRKAT